MPSVPPFAPSGRAVGWPSTRVIAWLKERLAAAGGDPSDIPDEPFAMWRLPEVERRTGYKRPSIYRMAARGEFPRPIPLSSAADRPAGMNTHPSQRLGPPY
jgi:predicted DNA-binding transcriptional regulator AlpA